ncbi:energy transducer TonB [Arenicella xantha]|uniref:Protein TonB n=1 Tax=Arenicella xantha TaxID=644221 RepID=A0A395JLC0_9GAMM|nr:TonB family protein [Arenicella xantha]RBP49768.1 protein TonB [Arenicella xantha]
MSNYSSSSQTDLLSVTAFFSALLHAVVILGISFKLPEIGSRASTDNTLDVVLLNSSNNRPVEDANVVSSTDNEGGGDDDQAAESPLPWKAVNPSKIQSVQKTANQEASSSLTPDQYITAQDGELVVQRLNPEKTKLESSEAVVGPDKFTINARQLERERLVAKLAQAQKEYNERPKKEFLSPLTKAHGAAEYLDAWKKRVTAVGNANYPVQIKANAIHGSLIITVEINANGTIRDIDINEPSKHKILNETAKRIMRDASPFAVFPDEDFFRKTDVLVITRTVHFLPDNRFTSTAASLPRK